jgi:hypothetical protein
VNDFRLNTLNLYCIADRPAAHHHTILVQSALSRFNAARKDAAIERIKSLLLGRTRHLLNLGAIPSGQVRSRHYGGIKPVSMDQICGSMDRLGDFDHHFHPLDDRLRDRWIQVAMARSQDIPLPPVSLIQVGNCYFVEDGHHRISVARARGETLIDAEITIWDVRGPLPWEQTTARRLFPQTA